MSDHWKSLTRLLGAPDAAEPPKKAKKAAAARPAADAPAADSPVADSPAADSPTALDPPEPLEDRSKPSSSSLLEDLTQVPDRQSLPGFEQPADAEGNASWDALVQDLGIEPNEPPAPVAETPEPAAKAKAKAKTKPPRRERESAKPTPRAADGFGSGLIDSEELIDSEDSLGDSEVVDAAVCELEAESQDDTPAADATSVANQDAGSEELTADDDDLFSGFKGRPTRHRRGEARSRDTDSRSEKPRESQPRESRSVSEDRPQPRETPRSEPPAEFGAPAGRRRSRSDRDSEPVGEDDAQQDAPRRRESSSESASRDSASRDSASRDSASPGRSRRGRRRGQRQRISGPDAIGFEDEDQQADPVNDEALEEDETGVQNSLDRIESSETEDEAPRRRRRRRRGRGGRGERSREEAGAERDAASEPRADRDQVRDDRDRNDQVRSEKVGPAIDAVFDDDHEDAEEVTELRRGRRRRPRRGRGGEKGEPQTERSGEPSGRDSEPAADEGAAPTRRHREVTTWQDTVDILISSNMSGRKNDSRGRGRQRSGGNSRRRD